MFGALPRVSTGKDGVADRRSRQTEPTSSRKSQRAVQLGDRVRIEVTITETD